jgi:hypothetical protein
MHAEDTKIKELTSVEKEMQKPENKKNESGPVRNTYSFDEALKSSVEYFKGDELAATVFLVNMR